MVRYEYQTCLRLSNTLKDDMIEVCEKHKINESDLIRRAVATFVQDLNSKQTNRNRWKTAGLPHLKVRGTNPLLLPQTPKCVTSYPKFAVVM